MDSESGAIDDDDVEVYDLPLPPYSIGGEDCDEEKYKKNLERFRVWYPEFLSRHKDIGKECWIGFWIDESKEGGTDYIMKRTFHDIIVCTSGDSIRMEVGKKIGSKYRYVFKKW